jgi:5-methylcytosine-specific restriction enzyme subunit McrC
MAVPLTAEERDVLKIMVPSLTIAPSPGTISHYDLTPSSTVGVLRIGDLQIEIVPRLPVDQVLFLVSYALDPRAWRAETTSTATEDHLAEAIIPTFVRHVRGALRRGLLHGYKTTDEALTTIRGRIRFADQLRARPGRALPVELQYDDFTADVLENRLLRAAIERLLRLPLRRESSRRDLRELHSSLATVTPVAYRTGRVPEPTWTRLNGRYRAAVDLARLILDNSSLNLTSGSITATSVLFDMASVFEDFVVVALREALGATARTFPQGGTGRRLRLDDEGGISLAPDLSWWENDRCLFVGDCKYKRAKAEGVPNADLYQLLAYTTALDLADGLLIYAAGEHPAGTHTVTHAGKRLHVVTLDLAGEPATVLSEIEGLAHRVRRLAPRIAA